MAKKSKSSGFKTGDRVMIINCYEASMEENKNKIWLVTTEPWDVCGSEVVKLEGKRGGFATKCLRKVEVT